jgi:hypothetical protein
MKKGVSEASRRSDGQSGGTNNRQHRSATRKLESCGRLLEKNRSKTSKYEIAAGEPKRSQRQKLSDVPIVSLRFDESTRLLANRVLTISDQISLMEVVEALNRAFYRRCRQCEALATSVGKTSRVDVQYPKYARAWLNEARRELGPVFGRQGSRA